MIKLMNTTPWDVSPCSFIYKCLSDDLKPPVLRYILDRWKQLNPQYINKYIIPICLQKIIEIVCLNTKNGRYTWVDRRKGRIKRVKSVKRERNIFKYPSSSLKQKPTTIGFQRRLEFSVADFICIETTGMTSMGTGLQPIHQSQCCKSGYVGHTCDAHTSLRQSLQFLYRLIQSEIRVCQPEHEIVYLQVRWSRSTSQFLSLSLVS